MLLVFIMLFFIIVSILIFLIDVKFYIAIKNNKSKIQIGLSLFDVPFFKYNVSKRNKKRKRKLNNKKIIKKKSIFYTIRRLSKKQWIYLEKINADIKICSGDAVATSIAVATVCSAIAFLLKGANVKINPKNFRYKATPLYIEKKIFDIDLDCIISVSLVHIISITISKWRCDRHGGKTSNRKSYDYGYEQHKRNDRRKYNYWKSNKSDG